MNVSNVTEGKLYMYFNTLKRDRQDPCPVSPAVEQSRSGHPKGRRSQKVLVDAPTGAVASLPDHTWHTKDGHVPA